MNISVKPSVWFVDTSSLMSMAVDAELQAVVEAELAPQKCVLLDVVRDELETLTKDRGVAGRLAKKALKYAVWLGDVVSTNSVANLKSVEEVQISVKGVRPLKYDREHWAEAVAIHIGSSLTPPILFRALSVVSEDHEFGKPHVVHSIFATRRPAATEQAGLMRLG